MTGLLVPNPVYKPFRYPWAYEAWEPQQRIHWLPEKALLHGDALNPQSSLKAEEQTS